MIGWQQTTPCAATAPAEAADAVSIAGRPVPIMRRWGKLPDYGGDADPTMYAEWLAQTHRLEDECRRREWPHTTQQHRTEPLRNHARSGNGRWRAGNEAPPRPWPLQPLTSVPAAVLNAERRFTPPNTGVSLGAEISWPFRPPSGSHDHIDKYGDGWHDYDPLGCVPRSVGNDRRTAMNAQRTVYKRRRFTPRR